MSEQAYQHPAHIVAMKEKLAKTVTFDEATGTVTFTAKFEDLYPEDGSVTKETMKASLHHLADVGVAVTDVFQEEVSKHAKKDKALKEAKGHFDGPIRGSSLSAGWSREKSGTITKTDGTKQDWVSHGLVTASWKGLGGPSGKAFDAVKNAAKEAAEKMK